MTGTTRIRNRLDLGGLVRREWYMTRLDWSLRELPSKESRRIRKDLRRSLKDSAGDMGMGSALADLGSPGALAQRYLSDEDREGPRWSSGALVAGLTVAAIVFLLQAYSFGVMDTLEYMGGGSRTINLWGSEISYVGSATEYSMATANILPALVVLTGIGALVFLLFSRSWRLVLAR